MFALLIITRILFIACIVFIIGYVFGGFSKRPALRTITRVASILLIVLFISMNIFAGRRPGLHTGWCHHEYRHGKYWHDSDHGKKASDSISLKR